MKHDRSAIMRRAHQIKKQNRVTLSEGMKLAWSEAKTQKPLALAPQRLPLEAIALDAWALAKKLKGARVDVGLRVRIDAGLRITPKNAAPLALIKQGEIGGGLRLN